MDNRARPRPCRGPRAAAGCRHGRRRGTGPL